MRLRTRVCCELVRLEHPLKASHSLLLRRAIVIAGIFFGSDKRRLVLRARGRLSRIAQSGRWWVRQTAAPLFLQKDVEEGVVNPDLAVIFDEAQFPEAIHEKSLLATGLCRSSQPMSPGSSLEPPSRVYFPCRTARAVTESSRAAFRWN